MTKTQNSKQCDLEDRTLEYSKRIIKMCKTLPKNNINYWLSDQCIRSRISMGANYREANETKTKKDFQSRIRICRKEGKETAYWLKLIVDANPEYNKRIKPLLKETGEFVNIFAAILEEQNKF